MASNNFMQCDTDADFEDSLQLTTPTLRYYMPKEKHKGAVKDFNSVQGQVDNTSTFSTVQVAKPLYTSSCDSFDSEATPRPPFTPTHGAAQSAEVYRYNEGGVAVHSADVILYNGGQSTSNVSALPRNSAGQLTRKPRHRRANSSISTISMSGVPEFMSAGQLLSPRGLSATSRLFDQADSSNSAKVYALRGEEINVGLGLTNVNVLTGPVECDDIYQFVHSENSGGIPVTQAKKRGKKRRRDVTDVDGEVDGYGDFVAISRYHLDSGDESSSSSEDDDEGIAQGGALLEVAPTPFPEFDEMKAALLEAAGEVYYTMPIGSMLPGTMEYVQQVRSRS